MKTNITAFLNEQHCSVPDNNKPDSDVASKVKTILMEKLDLDYEQIENEMDLLRDLGMDELDCMEFLMDIEHTFSISNPIHEEVLCPELGNDKEELVKEVENLGEKVEKMRKVMEGSLDMYVNGVFRVLREGDNFDDIDKMKVLLEELENPVKTIHELRGQLTRVVLQLLAEDADLTEKRVEELETQLEAVEEELEKLDVFGITKNDDLDISLATVGEIIALIEWVLKEKDEHGA